MSKILVLCSGGLDSTVLLYKAVKAYGKDNVYALSLYYGQKHAKELECIQYHVRKIWGDDVIHHFKQNDLSTVFDLCKDTNPMFDNDKAVPEGTYESQKEISHGSAIATYVPFRNGLFLAYAAAVAYQLDCALVAYGAHADDMTGDAYPDCSEEFIQHMNNAIYTGTGKQVRISAPFGAFNKHGIVMYGSQVLHMTQDDFDHTWSCYEGGDKPCGHCGTCLDRIKAFEGSGLNP